MPSNPSLPKGLKRGGGIELFNYLIKEQLPLTGMSRCELCHKLGISHNSAYLWEKSTRVPMVRAIQIAQLLGLDPIFVRNLAIKEWAPELFQEDERLRQFADLTRNESEFLEILRNSGKINPKMNDAQKAEFTRFVATLSEDRPTLKVEKHSRAKSAA